MSDFQKKIALSTLLRPKFRLYVRFNHHIFYALLIFILIASLVFIFFASFFVLKKYHKF